MRTKLFLFVLLVITAISCNDKGIDNAYISIDDLPAASYLKANPDEFSQWVDLLEYTNFFNALNLSGNYTCFVPDNDAVTAYLQSKGKKSVRDFDINFAVALVKYHTILASKKYTQSYFENGVISDTTASGDNLSIEIRDGGLNSIYVNSEARIKQLDISVTNAIIHTIEKVLEPITETVWDKVSANSNFTLLKSLISTTGYDTLLNSKKFKTTLFAVSDQVFANAGISTINDLASQLGAGADYTSQTNAVNKFVAYHMLQQKLSFSELATFTTTELSKNINTLAPNEILNISDVNGTLYLNRDTAQDSEILLTNYNNNCKNGMIHEIDNIMKVFSPKPASVVWEFTDYPELASLFSTVYRKTSLTSNSSNAIIERAVSCYTWKTILPDNMSSAVKYYVHKNSEERYKALNADYLRAKMGLYGWIEMKTPAIVKGTYNLQIAHHSPKGTNYKFTFILDGTVVGIITLPSNSSKDLYYNNTLLANNIVFDITKEHTIRILAGDNNDLELDYILFQPVN